MSGGAHLRRRAGCASRYDGAEVVAGLDLELEPGVCFGLLGPNGAGKTTTLRLCLGLTDPDSRRRSRCSVFRCPRRRARRGGASASFRRSTISTRTSRCARTCSSTAAISGCAAASSKRAFPDLLEFAELDRARGIADTDALGRHEKAAHARARARERSRSSCSSTSPRPGSIRRRGTSSGSACGSLTSEGRTILLTTHFMDEAERLCDRVAIIDHGRKIAEGAPRELIAQHIEPQVVEVYGDGAASWAERFGRSASERCEKTGETVFCYAHDAERLVHELERDDRAALSAPPGQSRRRVPEADRARAAGLMAEPLRAPAPVACASCTCGGATASSGASSRSRRCSAISPIRCSTCSAWATGWARCCPKSAACRTSRFSPPARCARAR